ncbi:hypothetical protein B0I37DRAFT_361601 [Chaetomium sp. MPI-CAGE-AT-0009]|nr:hypothetical protein B0I37DRAFT_361601 [Chaetomium sp. MPI-CAGE-AT-0009]
MPLPDVGERFPILELEDADDSNFTIAFVTIAGNVRSTTVGGSTRIHKQRRGRGCCRPEISRSSEDHNSGTRGTSTSRLILRSNYLLMSASCFFRFPWASLDETISYGASESLRKARGGTRHSTRNVGIVTREHPAIPGLQRSRVGCWAHGVGCLIRAGKKAACCASKLVCLAPPASGEGTRGRGLRHRVLLLGPQSPPRRLDRQLQVPSAEPKKVAMWLQPIQSETRGQNEDRRLFGYDDGSIHTCLSG